MHVHPMSEPKKYPFVVVTGSTPTTPTWLSFELIDKYVLYNFSFRREKIYIVYHLLTNNICQKKKGYQNVVAN